MLLISCVNCCYNGLQYDTMGTAVGYCTEHKRVLRTPSELTCGRLFRKDLPFATANQQQERHEAQFSPGAICHLRRKTPANGESTGGDKSDLMPLEADSVARAVTSFGRLNTKIESLAQLSQLQGVRADIALLSLGRTYVRRCRARGGAWTSGLHLLWWTRARLTQEPIIEISDIRVETALPLDRQIDLAKWSILMLRLTFLSDFGHHASGTDHSVRHITDLAEQAAVAVPELSFQRLFKWVSRNAPKLLDRALPEAEYERLSNELHQDQA